jgi:hypothetical protein
MKIQVKYGLLSLPLVIHLVLSSSLICSCVRLFLSRKYWLIVIWLPGRLHPYLGPALQTMKASSRDDCHMSYLLAAIGIGSAVTSLVVLVWHLALKCPTHLDQEIELTSPNPAVEAFSGLSENLWIKVFGCSVHCHRAFKLYSGPKIFREPAICPPILHFFQERKHSLMH